MTRLLIISEAYFPLAVPASNRMRSFARHLQPTLDTSVLTTLWDPKAKGNNEFVAGGRSYSFEETVDVCPTERVVPLPIPPKRNTWEKIYAPLRPTKAKLDAYLSGFERLRSSTGSFDLVLATAPSHLPLYVANYIKRTHGTPFIADLRDLSYQLPVKRKGLKMLPRLFGKLVAYKKRVINTEVSLCKEASLTTTVSSGLARELRRRGLRGAQVVLNGYEEDEFASPSESDNKFRVVYCGSLSDTRDPTILFSAVDQLLETGEISISNFEIAFYGSSTNTLERYLSNHSCRKVTRLYPAVTRSRCIAIMKGADCLLHLSAPRGYPGIFTSKITEYLASQTPIVSIPGDGDVVEEFLRTTAAGACCRSTVEVIRQLRSLLGERAHFGETKSKTPSNLIREYSRKRQADLLADLIQNSGLLLD